MINEILYFISLEEVYSFALKLNRFNLKSALRNSKTLTLRNELCSFLLIILKAIARKIKPSNDNKILYFIH